jgi:hypothetical protein
MVKLISTKPHVVKKAGWYYCRSRIIEGRFDGCKIEGKARKPQTAYNAWLRNYKYTCMGRPYNRRHGSY